MSIDLRKRSASFTYLHKQNMDFPMIVPKEYRSSCNNNFSMTHCNTEDTIHPLTMESRRFVCGDRFHTGTNPHKSPLCSYHDINLCSQSITIKTSYQESMNNKKNGKRLRSSRMQSMHTYILQLFDGLL